LVQEQKALATCVAFSKSLSQPGDRNAERRTALLLDFGMSHNNARADQPALEAYYNSSGASELKDASHAHCVRVLMARLDARIDTQESVDRQSTKSVTR